MTTKDRIRFISIGFIIWAAATATYRIMGSVFFESSMAGYWLNVVVTGGLYAAVSLGLMQWQNIERSDWLQGALCLALPGMLSEIPLLAGFSSLMSNMQPETAGRYAAFLFSGYSTLLGAAWLLSTKARSRSISEM
ncbi:DUF5367 domain-containing protein [Vacuolonema iberomarrocanum]|uniref:DUF5367 domain-containing protein n=1 Tax=Vacuolonema iberomarrocanum TaxID=3454632 RepID=UPI0019E3B5F7|nr:DUF5367 domain-containing protein [filamentous cyanobacterium LEGE 07170]